MMRAPGGFRLSPWRAQWGDRPERETGGPIQTDTAALLLRRCDRLRVELNGPRPHPFALPGNRLQALYEVCTASHTRMCRMSAASAEIAKLALNCFITVCTPKPELDPEA